jgi:hypothetical protein
MKHPRLWINFGWFSGDPFKLIDITIGETSENYSDKKVDMITFFSIQVIHFLFAFGWKSY